MSSAPARAADRLTRRTGPRLLAAGAGVTLPARLRARAERRRGGEGLVELYIAFEDPCSAVAVAELLPQLQRRPVRVSVLPVLERGLADDPAVTRKRSYALLDARRLAHRRLGLELRREEVLPASQVAFLAEWVASAPSSPQVAEFTHAALHRLWFEAGEAGVSREDFAALWREHLRSEPCGDPTAVHRCEKRMSRRGAYETPTLWTGGRWYFAHDRPRQICEWLDTLGWSER